MDTTKTNQITEGNKLIAEFMGYTHPYKCDIWRSGYCLKNVDLLSKYEFISLEQVLKEAPEINSESRPFYDNETIQISKYGEDNFYPNVVFFSTDSEEIPVTLRYNHRIQQYHSSWDWLMTVVDKIEKENASQFTYRYYNEINWGKELYVVSSSYFLHSYNRLNKRFKCESSDKLEAYWLAVVEYIKYYNYAQQLNMYSKS